MSTAAWAERPLTSAQLGAGRHFVGLVARKPASAHLVASGLLVARALVAFASGFVVELGPAPSLAAKPAALVSAVPAAESVKLARIAASVALASSGNFARLGLATLP